MAPFLKAYWLSIIITTLSSVVLFIVALILLGWPKVDAITYFRFSLGVELYLLLINLAIFFLFSLPIAFLLRNHYNFIIAFVLANIISQVNLFGLAAMTMWSLAFFWPLQLATVLLGILLGSLFHIFYQYYFK